MSLSKYKLNQQIDKYVNFEISYVTLEDGTLIRRFPDVPYKYGAKNTPSQIRSAVMEESSNWDGDILKSTSVLEDWMESHLNSAGIDCSGFVYYVLNEASYGDVKNQFNDTSYANGVNAHTLTSTDNGTQITKAKNMVPGCTIRTNNGRHILVIYDVIKNSSGTVTKIRYAHSNSGTGPHKAYILIGDENQDLDGSAQTWKDSAYSESYAKNLYDQTLLLTSLE